MYNNFTLGPTYLTTISICVLIGYIINGITLYTVAKAENHENAYFAWIPLLNNYLLIKLANGNPLFMLLLFCNFIPFLSIITSCIYMIYIIIMFYKLCERYKVSSLALVIIGVIIPIVMLIPYYELYSIAKHKIE